jgi:hypothetical protein
VVLSAPGASCATVAVDLDEHTVQVAACPDSRGTVAFALPLHFPSALGSSGSGGSRLGRVTVTQRGSAGRAWQQFISARGSVKLRIDMSLAPEVPAATPPPAVSAGSGSTPVAPAGQPFSAGAGCNCRHQPWLELEDIGDRSLPLFLALAAAPTSCPLPPPASGGRCTAPPTRWLLPGLGAVCILQAAALAALLLLHRRRSALVSSQPASSTAAPPETAPAPAPTKRRASLRDACTSPLALLASPFVRRSRQEAEEKQEEGPGLEAIPEEQRGEPAPQQQLDCRRGSFSSLPPLPTGWSRWVLGCVSCGLCGRTGQGTWVRLHKLAWWLTLPLLNTPCRDAWGRLQRQSTKGSGAGGGKAAALMHPAPFGDAPIMHPAPFGSASSSAYRRAYEE